MFEFNKHLRANKLVLGRNHDCSGDSVLTGEYNIFNVCIELNMFFIQRFLERAYINNI